MGIDSWAFQKVYKYGLWTEEVYKEHKNQLSANVALRAGTTTLFLLIPSPHRLFKIPAQIIHCLSACEGRDGGYSYLFMSRIKRKLARP